MGPIAAEVVPTLEEEAIWLQEHVTTNSALKTFIVRGSEDYSTLYREMRQKRRIPVNVMSRPNRDDSGMLILETLRSEVDRSSLILDTLSSQVDLEGETCLYDVWALLLHFEEETAEMDDGISADKSSDDEGLALKKEGLQLKQHN